MMFNYYVSIVKDPKMSPPLYLHVIYKQSELCLMIYTFTKHPFRKKTLKDFRHSFIMLLLVKCLKKIRRNNIIKKNLNNVFFLSESKEIYMMVITIKIVNVKPQTSGRIRYAALIGSYSNTCL